MLKRDGTTSSSFINYFALNNERNWEDLYIQLGNRQTCAFDRRKLIKGNSDSQSNLCSCFIEDLSMHHKCC